jgi:hypothetical protein
MATGRKPRVRRRWCCLTPAADRHSPNHLPSTPPLFAYTAVMEQVQESAQAIEEMMADISRELFLDSTVAYVTGGRLQPAWQHRCCLTVPVTRTHTACILLCSKSSCPSFTARRTGVS